MIRILQFNDSSVWHTALESVRHGLVCLRPSTVAFNAACATGSSRVQRPHRGITYMASAGTWILTYFPRLLDAWRYLGRRADVPTRHPSGITNLAHTRPLAVCTSVSRKPGNAARESFPGPAGAGDGGSMAASALCRRAL